MLNRAPLTTPTTLPEKAVQDISRALIPLLSDVFALYLKTKNFHWHMSGPHFRDYHLLLDEHGDQLFAMTDDIAERVRKLGGAQSDRSGISPACSASPTTTQSMSTRQICSLNCAKTTGRCSAQCAKLTTCATKRTTSLRQACWRIGSTRRNGATGSSRKSDGRDSSKLLRSLWSRFCKPRPEEAVLIVIVQRISA
jgi:ferritin-like protein